MAQVASAPAQGMTEEEAKKAWMSKLDAPSWGKAADALTQVVAGRRR